MIFLKEKIRGKRFLQDDETKMTILYDRKDMKMKRTKLLKNKVKAVSAVAVANMLTTGNRFVVWANGTGNGGLKTSTGIPQIDNIFSTLTTLLLGIVAIIGVIILIKNIADTVEAYQQHDSRGIYEGGKGIAAGAIMVFIGPLLTLMGVL